ncbi:MAG: hypothetical protein Fues2KO_18300 [Fuerstiella sp.]
MFRSSARRFFHNPTQRRMLTVGSWLVAIAIVAPCASSYVAERQQQAEAKRKLAELTDVEGRVERQRQRLEQSRTALAELQHRMIGERDAEMLRETITELVRKSNCRLKNITLDDRVIRRWMEDDHPLLDGHQFDESDEEAIPTEYLLETQRIEVSVSGTYDRVFELMADIEAIDRMLTTAFVEVTGDPLRPEIDIRWELLSLNLVHSPEEDIYDWD